MKDIHTKIFRLILSIVWIGVVIIILSGEDVDNGAVMMGLLMIPSLILLLSVFYKPKEHRNVKLHKNYEEVLEGEWNGPDLQLPDYNRYFAPVILITSGLFTWAIRGSSGFGGMMGCLFAGLLFGVTWYLFSREKSPIKSRKFSSGWTIFALLLGIGISGLQGWGDIASLCRGELQFNFDWEDKIPIDPQWGYTYMVLLGFHWAGTGALLLAWTGSKQQTNLKVWSYRAFFVSAGALLLWSLTQFNPTLVYPKYEELDNYNITKYPKLPELISEIDACLAFTGAVLGGMLYELIRKDYINVLVILIPGIITGIGWAYMFKYHLDITDERLVINQWRIWESSGGGFIGLGLGIIFMLFNKRLPQESKWQRDQPFTKYPNMERNIGIIFALCLGIFFATINGIKGWFGIEFWDYVDVHGTQMGRVIPLFIIIMGYWVISSLASRRNPILPLENKDLTPNFPSIYVYVYILLRILGLGVTRSAEEIPETQYDAEYAYYSYYVVLMVIDFILLFLWCYYANYLKNIRIYFKRPYYMEKPFFLFRLLNKHKNSNS
jgi:hypothetical protein